MSRDEPEDGGWSASAAAWIAEQGAAGDLSRRFVLDPAMLARVRGRRFRRALDIGCGEGRFCRMLRAEGIATMGIDPTARLLDAARARDPEGDYREGRAERLEFPAGAVDLVVSYLTLIDIADHQAAIAEMARVLEPGGVLLIANLNGFVTTNALGREGAAWHRDPSGRPLYVALDRYLEERPETVAWSGIRIENWHRPMEAYLQALIAAGLRLTHFAEPAPIGGPEDWAGRAARVPFFHVMEWVKP